MNLKIGLIINPIAGVGATLAWKGTDNVDRAWEAVKAGEDQPIWNIVERSLSSIPKSIPIDWYLASDYNISIEGKVVYEFAVESTTKDTKNAVLRLEEHELDIIIFAGGDGTAADIASTVIKTPILGIPGGVKIFSPCFLHRPEDLGTFLQNWEGDTIEVDILDLDEDAYRQGRAIAKLVTSATIPNSTSVQLGKQSWSSSDISTFESIAERIEDDEMLKGTIIVGPGSTMKNIFAELGLDLSLLGVDVIKEKKLYLKDATAKQLEGMQIDQIWITPIGSQGHIFGRGNRQISADIINRVGKDNIIIFGTADKIRNTKKLYVDTGDPELDSQLRGYISVIIGYHDEILKKIE